MNPVHIRPATPDDVPTILAMIRELAIFENEPNAVHATEEGLLDAGFGPNPAFGCLVAEVDAQPAAIALYFYNFSTWTGSRGLHLEDLFVRPEYRGQGIGKAMLTSVARIAVELGYPRLQWEVLRWNQNAIDFYHSRGARQMSEWVTMRVDHEALTTLAAQAPSR